MNGVLRPLRLGEILDQTAQLYRRNFLLFAGVAVIPTAVIFGVYIIIALVAGIPMVMRGVAAQPNPAIGGLFLVLMLIAMPFLLVPMVFSHAGVTRAAIDAFRGNKLKVREVLAGVKPRFWRYLGLMVLQGLIVCGIPMVCAGVLIAVVILIPGIAGRGSSLAVFAGILTVFVMIAAFAVVVVLATEFSMGMAACVVEERPARDALLRARKLSKGTRGRIFVMFLVVWCVAVVLSMVGYIPTMVIIAIASIAGHGSQSGIVAIVAAEVFNMLISFGVQTLISPVYLIALVLFYFDQRVRIEGYDIECLMQQAGLSVPAVVAVPNAIAGLSVAEANSAPAQEQ